MVFPTPMQKVKVWGPAVGMNRKWMGSTVVVRPGRKPTLLQEFPMDDARREDDYEMTSD